MKPLRVLLILLLTSSSVLAMSVEDAYRAIPHGRTVFESQTASMSPEEIAYLQRLFDWIDQAIVAKVTAMQQTPADTAYASIWAMEKTLKPSAKFKPLQALVRDSINNEYQYLKELQSAGHHGFNAGDPKVQAASQGAHDAYSALMRQYPSENAHNKQAFYDYLCALDFL